jgi:hypothetical protein
MGLTGCLPGEVKLMLDPEQVGYLPVASVPIESLSAAHSPRRGGEDPGHVRRLAQAEERLPPIVVDRTTMRVIDGMHRLSAARMRGQTSIEVRFFDGDEASAFVLAVRANVTHGLPLSLVDRKSAASRILQFYPQWSNRAVALASGLSANTVAQLRERPTPQNDQLDARVGADGRVRPLNGAERRAAAARLISEQPERSLRDIARRVGISPETARKIRAQLKTAAAAPGESGKTAVPEPVAAAHAGLNGHCAAHRTLDHGQLLSSLSADPALRYSELGRELLRALAAALLLDARGEQLAEILPEYRLGHVVIAARASAAAWQRFGQLIEQRQPGQPDARALRTAAPAARRRSKVPAQGSRLLKSHIAVSD